MTKQLLLMRHAKSDWNDAGLIDKERPLNARGRETAPVMAQWLAEHKQIPDLVLCSAAIRTQQTLDLMVMKWTALQSIMPGIRLPEIHLEDRLYLASASLILSIASHSIASHSIASHSIASQIASQRSKGETLMILGHNPGMENLASNLSEAEIAMPTGAIACFAPGAGVDWPADWSDAKQWKWRGLVKPREIGNKNI
jgi:phosphohistidine phosphatase